MNSAPAPEVNGEPETAEMPPALFIAKADTVPEPIFEMKAKLVVVPAGPVDAEFFVPQPLSKDTTNKSATKTGKNHR